MKVLLLAVAVTLGDLKEAERLDQVVRDATAARSLHVAEIRAGRLAVGMNRNDVRLALRARRVILGVEQDELEAARMTRRHSSTDEKGTEELWIYSELDGEAEQWVVFLDDVVSWIGNAAGYEERKAEAKRATKQQLEEQKDAVLAAANGPETWSKEGYQDARWGMPRGEVAKVIPGAGATQYDLSGFDLARTTTFLLDREFERVFVYKAGLLSEVVLHAKQSAPRDGELFQALRAVLAKKYGDPEDSSARAARWKLADTVIHLGFTASAPDAADRVFIRYIAGARVRDEEAREEAKRHSLEQQL